MKNISTKKRVAFRVGLSLGSLAVATAIGVSGFLIGSQSSAAADAAYQTGYSQASYNFCNLKFSTGVDAGKPYSDDIRAYEYMPKNVLVADALCTDDQVKTWNSAQKAAGSPERACKLDLDIARITRVLAAAECVATDSLN
ncbi:hypothetical protein [Rathayibacter toxicus]|uniref:Uncharacterized protein n=1 Tax=Rathayibacter toxicus TaxID=145458 RepID=A0A2S5Y530_9MICO|nr:hypothetical protein [Rathayibacter toxicus]PPH21699.1 hypothetical protein C5D17_09115 [Rathayibacter toxicus]PPH56128.1 hypothetical protein C5D30_09105 [Rathayibacter toxicus]PPH58224.1 hypothetical protein C5C93_09155 [Rathayibacter toxicus]PPH85970.1 hypothetical protein C5D31_09135 [Rathayibacter toxicus]PPI13854.1 hypothetical protein C5C51_09080 [Rathayibacter toxicus]